VKKLTSKQCRARAEAYLSASEHLLLDWTDDDTEREQGNILSNQLKNKYYEYLDKYLDSKDLENLNPN
jgi:hypothetical protein